MESSLCTINLTITAWKINFTSSCKFHVLTFLFPEGSDYSSLLGALDTAYLFAYAAGMFLR